MKKNGFVEAVTSAIKQGSDVWEAVYYCGDHHNPSKRAAYMHSRQVALGPEWGEFNRCALMARGLIRHA